MKNIFFFDIDNTLLDHATKAIPDSALAALDRLAAEGHLVALATGRSQCHAQDIIDRIQPAYAVTQNGARVLRGDAVVAETPVPSAVLTNLFRWASERGLPHGISDSTGGHVNAMHPDVIASLGSVDVGFEPDLARFGLERVFQAWLFTPESDDAQTLPELAQRFPEFDLVRWHALAIDLMPRGVNKMLGCQQVLEDAGLSAHQACAFGDGLNDMEMLQGVGMGIAMGNAHPRLKAVAKRIAEQVHLDGVAKMLAQLAREVVDA